MATFSFITRMPNEPGCLHRAAEIIKDLGGNINRASYDRKIDPHTVFFEIESDEIAYDTIIQRLEENGFPQASISTLNYLKFHVFLENRPGALYEFLESVTEAKANIAFMDFDQRCDYPERLTLGLIIEESNKVETLLEKLKSRYRLEVLEYDPSGKSLDDTVFYLRFASEIREIIGESEDDFLLKLLSDSNHIAQELGRVGKDAKEVFGSILSTGRTLRRTTGPGFSADVQIIDLNSEVKLYCFQLPCGGNLYVLRSPDEQIMIDTGFGVYHEDIMAMLHHFGIPADFSRIFITHADADHSGGASYFSCPPYLHSESLRIIEQRNRAYGSRMAKSVLEEVYTTLVNLFSGFRPPEGGIVLDKKVLDKEGAFDVVGSFSFHGMCFQVMESLGGHLKGHIFFLSKDEGILFTGDCLINFSSLTEDRQRFATLAKLLLTSVNVDSRLAAREREELMEIARRVDEKMKGKGKRCLVCGGHGAVSVLDDEGLVTFGESVTYKPN